MHASTIHALKTLAVFVAVHTLIQACLGYALGQGYQAACAAVLLPLMFLTAAVIAWPAVLILEWIGKKTGWAL